MTHTVTIKMTNAEYYSIQDMPHADFCRVFGYGIYLKVLAEVKRQMVLDSDRL